MFKVDDLRPSAFARLREQWRDDPRSIASTRKLYWLLLRCSVCQVVHGCTRNLTAPSTRGLILDGFLCACTHYLVFKEPTAATAFRRPELPCDVRQGNLLRLLPRPFSVKPLFPARRLPARGRPNRHSFGEPYESTKLAAPCQHPFSTGRIGLLKSGKSRGPETTNAPVFWSIDPPPMSGGSPPRQKDNIRRVPGVVKRTRVPIPVLIPVGVPVWLPVSLPSVPRATQPTIRTTCCCCLPFRSTNTRPPIAPALTSRSRSFATRRLLT
jgi:hypothetical protein